MRQSCVPSPSDSPGWLCGCAVATRRCIRMSCRPGCWSVCTEEVRLVEAEMGYGSVADVVATHSL
jgi:hypothetical protein